jgi:transcriptional regulator with XRE-family HTH domain
MEGEIAQEPTLFPATVGEKLRAAREAQGLELAEIASRTRIPQRHLETIENGNYAGLPSVTYAFGFAKAYARAVGADEIEIGRELRREIGNSPERVAPMPSYPMEDPTRVPSRGIVWAGVIVAVLLLVGAGLWYGTGLFRGEAPDEVAAPVATDTVPEATEAPANAAAPAPVSIGGDQVTLVALDTVWVRVSDASGQRLYEKEMAPGERYDVPPTADRPRLRTGRPDRLQVLINGSNVPPLGTGERTIEAEVGAAALKARSAEPAGSAAAAPDANTLAVP